MSVRSSHFQQRLLYSEMDSDCIYSRLDQAEMKGSHPSALGASGQHRLLEESLYIYACCSLLAQPTDHMHFSCRLSFVEATASRDTF